MQSAVECQMHWSPVHQWYINLISIRWYELNCYLAWHCHSENVAVMSQFSTVIKMMYTGNSCIKCSLQLNVKCIDHQCTSDILSIRWYELISRMVLPWWKRCSPVQWLKGQLWFLVLWMLLSDLCSCLVCYVESKVLFCF